MSNLITARKNYIPPSYIRAAAADKRANPWNYADDVSTVSLWLNSDASRGGLFNMTKAANPLSKANIGSTLSGVTSVLGPIASNLISDGYSVGSGFNTVMSTVQALNTGNPVFDTIKNVAATAIQGLGNRAFGTKKNEANINALNVNKAQARTAGTTLGSASTTNDLLASAGQMTGGTGFKTTDLVKGGWFAKGKARKQGLSMLNQETAALAYLNHGLQTGANNVDTKQDSMVMRNFAALGGPLIGVDPSTAIGYQLYTDKYVRDNNRSVPNMFAGTPLNLFETGGPKKSKKQKDAEDNIDNLIWYLGQRMKYPYGRKKTEFEKFLNNDLDISERTTEPWFGDANTPTIFSYPISSPSPEEKLQNSINNTRKIVNSIGTGTRKVVSQGEPYIPHMTFALGGDIQTHGADWDTGVNHVNAGGTHEENPYDGVQMGVDQLNVPNLVEEGEVIYKDYVFSNRLDIPKYDRKDTSREAKVLRKYSGKTFADTAKKIEKRMGADERTDAITKAGLDVELQLLAQVLEKERQKLQLLEMQDAIDNMTPEEFAMLQLQMQAQQDAEALQEAMAQQQQLIPLGMEQMAPPGEMMSAYGGPIYALGGLLEDNDNVYAYGGSFADFNKDLEERGLTLEDYLRYLVTTGALSLEEAAIYSTDKDAVLLENSFNKELAEKYLNSLNTKEKEVARMYRKKGQNPKKLTGAALQKYQEDVIKVTKNPELLDKDADKLLFINLIGKSKPEAFNAAANAAIVKENRDAFLPEITLNDNGKIAIQYNNEGTIPQALSFIQNGLTYDGKNWKDALGNIVDNPYSKEYGFTGVSRDWSKYGYLNPKDNTWTNVDYNPPTEASGNTDYRYTPWNLWFTLSGMNADEYEAQDAYLNNYLDFLDDIYNKESPNHQAALRRLYEMGEATKSNAPGELKGKNRYFDTDKEGFDANNLSLDNLRIVDGNNTIGDQIISGFSVYNKAASDKAGISNKLYYANKNGLVISPTTFLGLDEKEKKDWTPLDHKGLTRQDVLGHLKAVRNIDWDTEPGNLLFKSMFDNNPAQSYLMAPNGTKRYALVDELGNYIKDGDKIRYLDYNPDATYNFYKKDGTNVTPIESLMIDGVNVDTIGVLGGTVDNHIGVRRNPDGTWQSYRLTPEQAAKLKQREIASTDERYGTLPQFEEAVGGYTLNPHYYELDDDAYKSLGFNDLGYAMNGQNETDPFPRAPWWPYLAGAGLLLASLGYNMLAPKDYSNANAMIKAAQEAGTFTPVEFKPIGNYLTYRPMDIWAELNRMNAAARATDRAIMNSSSPYSSKVAGLLASGYNEQLGSGELFKKSLEYNDALNKQVAEFNKDTDKFNSEGLLKRDMANQDAATRARGFTLEGLKSGYAMRQAIDDAKSNAISAGISGLTNLAYNYAANKYNQDLMGWGMRHNSWGPGVYYEKDAPKKTVSTPTYVSSGAKGSIGAKGGRLKVRRKKGLGF